MKAVRMERLGDELQGAGGDDVLDPEDAPHGDEEGEHHGKAGMDGPGDEIGREDGAVPAGLYGQREVPGDDGMDGDHEGRCEARHQEVGHGVMAPLPGRPCPAEGQKPVNLAPETGRAVTDYARSGTRPVYQKMRLTVK